MLELFEFSAQVYSSSGVFSNIWWLSAEWVGGAAGAGAADQHEAGIKYAKEQNFSQWYSQVITKSKLIEYYDISGSYILRPAAFFIWEQI